MKCFHFGASCHFSLVAAFLQSLQSLCQPRTRPRNSAEEAVPREVAERTCSQCGRPGQTSPASVCPQSVLLRRAPKPLIASKAQLKTNIQKDAYLRSCIHDTQCKTPSEILRTLETIHQPPETQHVALTDKDADPRYMAAVAKLRKAGPNLLPPTSVCFLRHH